MAARRAHNPKVDGSTQIVIERTGSRSIVARVPGADLPFRTDDNGTPWVEAEALGAWVGFARPRKARDLVKRLTAIKILNDSEVCTTVGQTSCEGGRPAQEHWLTREGALKFAARSDTPRAIALLDLIVRVFVAVVDGSRRPVNDNATAFAADEVRQLRDELARLRAMAGTSAYPWGSEARVSLLRSMCGTLAEMWCRLDANTTPAAERSRVQMKMRSAIGYAPGRGHSLRMLTTDEFERAVRWLHSELADAERQLPKPAQLRLVASKKR